MFGNRTIFDRVLCQFYRQTFPIVAVDIKSFSIYVFFFYIFFPFKVREDNALRAKRQLCDAAALMGCRIEH